ncbi:MAG: HNH endonuclease signature motif containing protein [Candidatus Sedimenticola sp. (ex Thyasira tokunagai)]
MARKDWTAEEEAELKRDYPETPTKELAKQLSCTEQAVYSKASSLGLHKSEAYFTNQNAGRMKKGDERGAGSRFRKGNRPHNAGKKGWQAGGRSTDTQFKKGKKPHTWKPIGSERVTTEGYMQRKMTDTGYPPKDWVAIHTLLWEEHNGPIPKGHVVVFKNGNKLDVRIDNLELISRTELMRRNTVHNLPKELVQVVQLKGAVTRQINKRMKA